jgi:hypothetical protein
VLDPLHAGHDDQVQNWALAILFPDLVRGLLDEAAHCFADFAAGPNLKLLHRLLDALDLHLGLLDVHLNALAQRGCTRHLQGFLHAPQSLFLGAICILELFAEQLTNFGFHFRILGLTDCQTRLVCTVR